MVDHDQVTADGLVLVQGRAASLPDISSAMSIYPRVWSPFG